MSFNTDKLINGTDYDYVTRTSLNQGVLQTTGFVNFENINQAGNWSLGLLQMDFFYREKPWYAGQFVRKITPLIDIPKECIMFITTLLNRQKKKLLSVLVRNVDKAFEESIVDLPIKNDAIDFEFIKSFNNELEALRIEELETYLTVTGLKDYILSEEEEKILKKYSTFKYEYFNIVDIFKIKNTSNILSSDIIKGSGTTPYLCASSENNAVSSYISYNDKYLDEGNCIFIGGKTFVVTYQENDFYSNDSHNLALYLKNENFRNKFVQLFMATCVNKSLSFQYSWGDSISGTKIKKDKIYLPVVDEEVDYNSMKILITAVQKLVIKELVKYTDNKINSTKKQINCK